MRRSVWERAVRTTLVALALAATLIPVASAGAASTIVDRSTFIDDHTEPDYDADDMAAMACFEIDTPYDSDFDFTTAPGAFNRSFSAAASFSDSCPGGSVSAAATAHVDALTTVQDTGGAILFAVSGSESGSVTQSGSGVLTPTTSMEASLSTNVNFTVSGAPSQLVCTLTRTASGAGLSFEFSADGVPVAATGLPLTLPLAPGTHNIHLGALVQLDANGAGSQTYDARCSEGEPVVITDGPGGRVASRDARLTFAALTAMPPAGHYECSLDGGAALACTSPQTYAALVDGAHHFEVRYVVDGSPPGPATTRDWTVDGTAPRAVIDEAPSGDENGPDATITFHADTADVAGFECSVDSAPPTGCTSPLRLSGLAIGAHVLEIRAFDALGNAQPDSTVVQWTVADGTSSGCEATSNRMASLRAGPALQCVVCPAGTQARVAFGQVVALALDPDRCFRRRTIDGRSVMATTGPASVNGLGVTPLGSQLILDSTFQGGEFSVGRARLSVGSLSFEVPALELGALNTGAKVLHTKAVTVTNELLKKAGLKILPSLDIALSKANDGQIEVRLKASLPAIGFSSVPKSSPVTAGEGVTLEIPVTTSNARGVTGGIRASLDKAWFGPVEVRKVFLSYDHASRLLSGGATLMLETVQSSVVKAEPGIELAFEIPFGADAPTVFGPFSKLSVLATSVQRQIKPGIYLQRFGAAFAKTAAGATVSATAGLSAGPRFALKPFFEGEAASLDGTVTFATPAVGGGAPFSLTLDGAGKLIEIPIANVKLVYRPLLDLTLTGDIEFSVFGYGVRGELVDFWVSPDGINAEARGTALLGGFQTNRQFETVVSTVGYATCSGLAGARYGFGRTWFDDDVSVFGESCDLGPFREARPARRLSADGAPQTFTVPAGRRVMGLLVRGVGGPPRLELHAPGGAVIATTVDGSPTDDPRALIVQDAVAGATRIVLIGPEAGTWTIVPLPGGGALSTVATADPLPVVVVTASTAARGTRRVLTWTATHLDGQELRFVERSARGTQELLRTRRGRGSLVFTPQATGSPARRIEVTVLRQGLPRQTTTVARFRVAGPPALRRVGGLRRTARLLTWRAQPAAVRYAVAIRRPDGVTTSAVVSTARYVLPADARRVALRVTIKALAGDGRSGPAAALRLRPPA